MSTYRGQLPSVCIISGLRLHYLLGMNEDDVTCKALFTMVTAFATDSTDPFRSRYLHERSRLVNRGTDDGRHMRLSPYLATTLPLLRSRRDEQSFLQWRTVEAHQEHRSCGR